MIRALTLVSIVMAEAALAQIALAPVAWAQGALASVPGVAPDGPLHAACLDRACTALGPPAPVWALTAQPGDVHGAEISVTGRTLGYLCHPSGSALVALKGLGGGAPDLIFQVDGQRIAAPFVTQDEVHYGPAGPGSPLLEAMMQGRQVTAVAGQITVSFPLEGSAAAIGQAMARCGLS